MVWRTISAAIAVSLAMSACASLPRYSVRQALVQCQAGARHVEVRDRGIVERVLGIRYSRSGRHEGFLVLVDRLRDFRFEDNVDITGPIPLHRGAAVEFQGQFECNDEVIHWTHHDPRGRHPAGYIIVDGRTYE